MGRVIAIIGLTLGLAPAPAYANAALIRASYDLVRLESGVNRLAQAFRTARAQGLIQQDLHALSDARVAAQLERVDPGITEDQHVLYLLEHGGDDERLIQSLTGSEDVWALLSRESFGKSLLGGASHVPATLPCASGKCPIADVAAWVRAAAAQATKTMPVAVRGTVHVDGPVVSVVEYGDRTVLRGEVANLLARFPDATVEVQGTRVFENGGSRVSWEPRVRVQGQLRELDPPYEGRSHQLLSNQRMVFVDASTPGVAEGWFEVSLDGRTVVAAPTSAP